MKLVYVPMMMVLLVMTIGFTSITTTARPTTTRRWTTTTTRPWTTTAWTTTGPHDLNLIGKMFTLSRNGGGISFYSSYLSSPSTPWHYTSVYPTRTYKSTTTASTTTTKPTTTASTTHHPWTTTIAPPTRGVSVCLRYLTDYVQDSNPVIFTLSPSTTPLRLMSRAGLSYGLAFNLYSYPNLFLQPKIRFWSNIAPDIWTRLCLTVDTMKNVAQVFSGSSISIRKILPNRYVWSGEPVIDFSGFDGQVTDVQIWDHPLLYREIYNYMVSGVYGPHRGSVLTWSSISYSPRGNIVMEDVYEQQSKQSLSSSGRWRHLKGKKKTRKFWNLNENKARKRQEI